MVNIGKTTDRDHIPRIAKFIPPPDRAKYTKGQEVPRMNFYYENSGSGKDYLMPKVQNAIKMNKMNVRSDILKHK